MNKHEQSAPVPQRQRLHELTEAIWATRAVAWIAGVVGIVCVVGVISLLRLVIPGTTIYSAKVQFTFPEAAQRIYPSEAPFSINELIDPSVLSAIYADHNLAQYGISRE